MSTGNTLKKLTTGFECLRRRELRLVGIIMASFGARASDNFSAMGTKRKRAVDDEQKVQS